MDQTVLFCLMSGFVGVTQEMVLKKTQDLVRDRMLLICIRCGCLTALNLEGRSLQRGGELYEEAVREVGELKGDKLYTFNKHRQLQLLLVVGFT